MAVKATKQNRFAGFSTIELLIVIVIIIILGSLIVITYNGVQQRNRDTERKNDIVKLEGQVEAYQAETNTYPSSAQMNSQSFRTANMKDLQVDVLADPQWKTTNKDCSASSGVLLEDSSTPSTGCYGYDPSPAGCDNKNTDCTSYVLTADLESGGVYTKSSLN